MGMADPVPQYSYLVREIANRHPNLAYIHIVEPRVTGGGVDREAASHEVCEASSVTSGTS